MSAANDAAIARARDAGRRAFARDDESNENIYNLMARAFDEGYDEARRYRDTHGGGLDMGGHPPMIPHVCPADPKKVCVCCSHCAKPCQPTLRNALGTLVGAVYNIVRRSPTP
jgi:hypothetical protein